MIKALYNMHNDSEMDRRINELLSGLEKIIDATAEIRNKNSDAHDVGQKHINISEHHARLYVNSAITLADFIFSGHNLKGKRFDWIKTRFLL